MLAPSSTTLQETLNQPSPSSSIPFCGRLKNSAVKWFLAVFLLICTITVNIAGKQGKEQSKCSPVPTSRMETKYGPMFPTALPSTLHICEFILPLASTPFSCFGDLTPTSQSENWRRNSFLSKKNPKKYQQDFSNLGIFSSAENVLHNTSCQQHQMCFQQK